MFAARLSVDLGSISFGKRPSWTSTTGRRTIAAHDQYPTGHWVEAGTNLKRQHVSDNLILWRDPKIDFGQPYLLKAFLIEVSKILVTYAFTAQQTLRSNVPSKGNLFIWAISRYKKRQNSLVTDHLENAEKTKRGCGIPQDQSPD